MRRSVRTLIALGCILTLAACTAKRDPNEPLLSGTLEESLVEATAVVERVDQRKRTVTIRRPDGKRITLPVDEQVKNLPQVEPGDEVVVAYYESIAFDVLSPDSDATPGVVESAETESVKKGTKPGASEARMVTVTSTIESIDRAMPAVTLRGPEGESHTIKVRDPQKLEGLEAGDLIELHYTQALAISVRETAPRP